MEDMNKWLRREKLKVNLWSYSAIVDEYSKSCNVVFRPRSLRSDICLSNFAESIHTLFDSTLGHEFAASAGRHVTWADVFEADGDIEMDFYDRIFLVKLLMGEIYSFKLERLSKYLPVMLRIDLVNKKYYIMDNRQTFVMLSAPCERNIFKLLYEFHKGMIENYERMDNREKVDLLMRKNKIIVDFTAKEHTYAYNSHRIIIGRSADLNVLIDFLLNGDSRFIQAFFNYFTLFVLNRKLVVYRLTKGYSFFANSLKNDMMRVLKISNVGVNCTKDSYAAVDELIDAMNPAAGRYLIYHLKSMDEVSVEWTEDDGREIVCFKPVISLRTCGFNSFFADKYIVYDSLRKGLRYCYTNDHVVSSW